jgi:hypothetical protein
MNSKPRASAADHTADLKLAGGLDTVTAIRDGRAAVLGASQRTTRVELAARDAPKWGIEPSPSIVRE